MKQITVDFDIGDIVYHSASPYKIVKGIIESLKITKEYITYGMTNVYGGNFSATNYKDGSIIAIYGTQLEAEDACKIWQNRKIEVE